MPKRSHKFKKYSTELKMKAVKDYLNVAGSLWDIFDRHIVSYKIGTSNNK